MNAKPIILDGRRLSPQQVADVARSGRAVQLASAGLQRARIAHEAVQQIARRRPIYGQSSGVGSNKDAGVSVAEAPDHGLRLLRSHAVTAGTPVSPEVVRAMMVVRLNQLAAGGSGVNPAVLELLVKALNQGLTPPVLHYSAIGTADLGALATTALCIMGERPWQGGSLAPLKLGNTDALAFMSSSAATLGEAALACHDLQQRLQSSLTVAAMSWVAMGGSAEAYAEAVQLARPHPGQQATAARLRELLEPESARAPRRIQDPYNLRALPQVHGPALDAAQHLAQILASEMNASSENPLVSARHGDVFHNGNFHTAYLALVLDQLRAALYQTAALSAARISSLMEPAITGLRPFLAVGAEANSGALMLEYVAHSALADLRQAAAPVTLAAATLSRGAEEHAPFSPQAAWRTTESVTAYDVILACELVAAVRALRQLDTQPAPGPLRTAYDQAAAALSVDHDDRPLDNDIATAVTLIMSEY
jgi:histidine ammonia-lyase